MRYEIDPSRRLTETLLRYWLHLRQKRPFPKKNELEMDVLNPVWDDCYIVRLTDKAAYGGYEYDYLGKNLEGALGEGDDQATSEKLVMIQNPAVVLKFDSLMARRRPIIDEDVFEHPSGKVVKYRQVVLPLASDESGKDSWEISYILGGMRWKYFDA